MELRVLFFYFQSRPLLARLQESSCGFHAIVSECVTNEGLTPKSSQTKILSLVCKSIAAVFSKLERAHRRGQGNLIR